MPTSADIARPQQSQLVLAAVRMLIASYFLASAGLIKNADGATFLSSILPPTPAEALATSIFYGTGFALMIGRFMREAALVLAIFIFWSSFGTSLDSSPGGQSLMDLWRDMALIGAVLLIGLTQPGGHQRMRLPFTRARKPRRVTTDTVVVRRRERPQTPAHAPQPLRIVKPVVEDDDDEDLNHNLFADCYEARTA